MDNQAKNRSSKPVVTQRTIIEEIQYGTILLDGTMIAGVFSIFLILLICVYEGEKAVSALHGYIFFCLLVGLLFIYIPGKEKDKITQKVEAVKQGNICIKIDTIEGKACEEEWSESRESRVLKYVIYGKQFGRMELHDRWDWEACRDGGKVYVVFLNDKTILAAIPSAGYVLGKKLSSAIIE